MYFDISFVEVAVVILTLLLISKLSYIKSEDIIVRRYLLAVITALITSIFHIVFALAYEYYFTDNDLALTIMMTIYILLVVYSIYSQAEMICVRVDYSAEFLRNFNLIIATLFTILMLINMGTNFIFSFKNHVMVKTFAYAIVDLVELTYILEMLFVLIKHHEKFRKRVLIITSLLGILQVGAFVVWHFDETILFWEASVATMLMLFGFTLGDQDYQKLEKTILELEESKRIESKRKEEIEHAFNVKTRFLESISNELSKPITSVKEISNDMLRSSEDEKIINYATRINDAANELDEFVNELINEVDKEKIQ